ncbi:MAG: hypothetical protein MUF24_08585 [Chitinophagaceae bacterium]|jgi:hypothetical protein|nr:hypothetical protein [Chitinophagaceae bacterium]
MQKFYLVALTFFLVFGGQAQQHHFAVGYGYNVPGSLMRQGFTGLHSVLADYRISPKNLPALSMGASLQYGSYASWRQPQLFTFPDGSITQTTVLLTSSTATIAGTARYTLRQGKKLMPYAELQAGWFAAFSNYFIENPHIIDGLSLDRQTVHSDETYLLAAGAGLQFDLSGGNSRSRHYLELGVRSIRGGSIDYANMRRLTPLPAGSTGNTLNNRTILVENIAMNSTYESSTLQVYTAPLRLLQCHLTYQFSLRAKRR